MSKKLSDLQLKPSEITCSGRDFLEFEQYMKFEHTSDTPISKRVVRIITGFNLLSKELELGEEDLDLKKLLLKLKNSDNLSYHGLASKVEEILCNDITVGRFYELIQGNIDTISHTWVKNERVTEIFAKRGMDSTYFEIEIGRGVLRYFTEIFKDSRLIGDCPVLRAAIRYFQENQICLDDVYLICNELKHSIKDFLYKNTILSLNGYVTIERDIDILLSKNLKNILAYFTSEFIFANTKITKELEELTVSKNELENIITALDNSSIVQIISKDGVILGVNERTEEITGFSREEMVGRKISHFNSGFHSPKFWSNLWEKVSSGEIFRAVVSNKASDDSIYWTDTTITPYRNPEGEIEKFIVIRHDITDLVETRNKLQERNDELKRLKQSLTEENKGLVALSNTDALTGLQNRRYFDYILEHEIKHARVTGNPVSLLMLDIDNFKQINDRYGHDVGDIVLQKLGELVTLVKRQTDVSARYGGEEFIMVFSGTKRERAIFVAEKLRDIIKSHVFTGEGYEFSVTVSMGLTELIGKESTTTFFKRTDKLMYRAKQTGKDKICF